MSRLVWSAVGERYYEVGVDHGVLYVDNAEGVPWVGLISIAESPTGGEAKPYYFDGIKYLNISASEEFEATIEAFYYPPEFAPCDGTSSVMHGLFATQQPRKAFSLSYRTKIGNDTEGSAHAYKIHLVYNALAAPSERENKSLSDSAEASAFSWALTTLPPSLTGRKPTAHFVIDSRYVPKGLMAYIEDILYGTDAMGARLPSAQELVDLFSSQGPLIRRNLITSRLPFSASTTAVEVRRNLASDPAASASKYMDFALTWTPNWYGASPAAGATTIQSGTGPLGTTTTFIRKSWTAVGTNSGDTGFAHSKAGNLGFVVKPGEVYTVSSYVRSSAAGKMARIRFKYSDSAGATTTLSYGPGTALGANQWSRISMTETVPTGAAFVEIWSDVYASGTSYWAVNDTLDGTGLLVEKGTTLSSYFDGSTAARSDGQVYSWVGTAAASQSIAKGPVEIRQNLATNPGPRVSNSGWGGSGSSSSYDTTVTMDGINTIKSTDTGGGTSGAAKYDVPIKPGMRLGIAGTMMVEVDTVIDLGVRWKTMTGTDPNSVVIDSISGPITVQANVPTRISGIVTVPTDNGWIYCEPLFRMLKVPYTGVLSWHNQVVVTPLRAGQSFDPTYFDGNTLSKNGETYTWVGTANNSVTSVTAPLPNGYSVGGTKPPKQWISTEQTRRMASSIKTRWDTDTGLNGNPMYATTSGLTVGKVYTVSVWIYVPSGSESAKPAIRAAGIGSGVGVTTTDTWTQDTYTFTAVGTSQTFFVLNLGPTTEGQVCYISDLMLNEGTTPDEYIDGDMSDVDANYYNWEGTPNASVSALNSWN